MTKAQAKDTQRPAKSGYELWQTTIDGAASDLRWQDYDCDIQRGVNQFQIGNPGDQSLRYTRASVQKVITRWTSANATSIARLYNVGDPAYAKKLTYCMSVMQKAKQPEESCA